MGNKVSPILTPLTTVKDEVIIDVEDFISAGQFFLDLQSSVLQQIYIDRKSFPQGHFISSLSLRQFLTLCPGSKQ